MRERTITINGMSKTYSVTGGAWAGDRPPDISSAIRKVHDFLTVGAAAPLQDAGAMACALPDAYYTSLPQITARVATASSRSLRKLASRATSRMAHIT